MVTQTFSVDLTVTENGRKSPQYFLGSDLSGEITLQELLEFTKSSLIIIADEVLREEQGAGFDKEPVTLVDGKKNRDIRVVHPLGQIEFISRQSFDTIILDAYNALLELSKVKTGRYKSSHYVFHNGKQVATDLTSLGIWLKSAPEFQERDTIRIVNIQPYARRLELLGVTSTRSKQTKRAKKKQGQPTGTIVNVPNGAYQLTYRRVRYKYKNNVFIRFSFLQGSQLGISGNFGAQWGKKRGGRPYLFPTLVFGFQSAGVL